MNYVYILQLSDGSYYKGMTRDILSRLENHRNGNVKSTKNKLPFKVLHVEICKTRRDARKIEKFFKSGFGREIIHEISNFG